MVTLKNDQNVRKSIEVMVYVSFTTQQNIESQMWKAKDLECSQGAETQKINKFLGRGDLEKWSKRTIINRGDGLC